MRFSTLALLAALPALAAARSPLDLLADASQAATSLSQNAIRGVFVNVLRFNESSVDKILKPVVGARLPEHPYALDITDENWETVLRTGTYNSLAPSLPDDTVWVLHVYGPDPVSKILGDAFDAVALHNSSQAGGELPSIYHFGRISYVDETILPTRFWLWKPPVLVVAKKGLKELRFFRTNQIPPYQVPISNLLAHPEVLETMPVWQGMLAPGGSLNPYLLKLSNGWSEVHAKLAKVPNFLLLILSGFLMNFVVSWFHKKPEPKKTVPDTPEVAAAKARLAALRQQEARAKSERKKKLAEEESQKAAAAAVAEEEKVEEEPEAKETIATGAKTGKGTATKRK